MSDKYNAHKHLNKLKQQSEEIQWILFHNKYPNYVEINIKLANCCRASIVENNRINQQFQSCDSPFCPICASAHRIRRECGITYGVMDKIIQENGGKSAPVMRFLTLTVPKVPIFQFEDSFKQLRADLKTFLYTKMEKGSKKIITFNQYLLGGSVYYHLSFTDDFHGNPLVGIHLHAILLLKSSFTGVNSITKRMVSDYWMILAGQRTELETNIKTLTPTHKNYIRAHAYGLAKYDFDEAIANPAKYVQLLPLIKRKHFQRHFGLIADFRIDVREEYKINQEIAKKEQMLLDFEVRKDNFYEIAED